jgi:solute carrier family 29 (equilibrative nucleoside transporter), member 1/2/3
VKFYRSKAASEGSLTVAADLAAGGIQNRSNRLTGRNFDQIKSVN